jgi:hypothetical protein
MWPGKKALHFETDIFANGFTNEHQRQEKSLATRKSPKVIEEN